MNKYPWNEEEYTTAEVVTNARGGKSLKVNTPCSDREEYETFMLEKKPIWMPMGGESTSFCPKVIPDCVARAFVIEAENVPKSGGIDMFGIKWVLEPTVGGCIEDPNEPILFDDVNEWEEKIVWPDIDSWDWEGSAKANKDYLNNGKANMVWFLNGCWFERLISFMGFENAVMALIDDEQEDALKALFTKTTDLYCRLVDKCCDAYGDGISGFVVHDDWGSQKDAFFSPEVGREIFLPFMKQLVDHIHSRGKIAFLHSCGCLNKQVGTFADAGWDSWTPMTMNDTVKMYDDYGDRIIIGVVPEAFDPATTSEEEQERLGAEFAKRFPLATCNGRGIVTPAFIKGYYKQSRLQGLEM